MAGAKPSSRPKTVSTSAIFRNRKSRGGNSLCGTPPPKRVLKETIAEAFARSKDHIRITIDARLETVQSELSTRLTSCWLDIDQQRVKSIQSLKTVSAPLEEDILSWATRADGSSGKTTVGYHVERLARIVKSEGKALAQEAARLADVEAEIRSLATDMLGTGSVKSGTVPPTDPGSAQLRSEIDALKERYVQMLNEAANESMEEMRESEEILNLRQQRTRASFYAMLEEEED